MGAMDHIVAEFLVESTESLDQLEIDLVALEKDPKDQETIAQFREVGALPPRTIRPRNLREGIFRGGRRPIDIYWRIKNGIAGSGMPEAAAGVTEEDLWHLVDYVRSLEYDELSRPSYIPDFQRERN